jgi:ABC-type bacteriocin/lantibiotic exporter with double-glycine peptidase domain
MADTAAVTRRFFIPEVIQTSAMDCGPAALKALFGGFNRYLSYGRLREACQTDVDGTSIDTIEVIAQQLGLGAVQSMLPLDLLLLKSSAALPAVAVVATPDGGNHLVVLWRAHGPWLQVMDPAAGRLWVPRRRLLESLYIHEQPVPADASEAWCASAVFTAGIEQRLRALHQPPQLWADRAHQDAALRLGGTLRDAGRLRPGAAAREFLSLCAAHPEEIPPQYWSIRRLAHDPRQVLLRGAVLLSAAAESEPPEEPLPASLARVRNEPAPRVWQPVWAALRENGWGLATATMFALCAVALGTVIEALLFRGLFDMGRHLQSTAERLGAIVALVVFLATVLALDWSAAIGSFRLGRQIEMRLRTRFLLKMPRLSDRYFQSRLISDMAFRAHSLQLLRQLPELAGHCLYLIASIVITGAAIVWVYPGSALLAILAVVAACGVPALLMPAMAERDLRHRELGASLGLLYLDSLLGSRAIQAHCAQRTMRSVQAGQLERWAAAGLSQQCLFVRVDALQMAATLACIVALVYRQSMIAQSPAGLLLLIYWAISIPLLGREAAAAARSLPAMRNTLLRFLELIESPEEAAGDVKPAARSGGVKIDIEEACVVVGGHAVLDRVTLQVQPGEHIGIVGVSGAGKSSLVGCLMGWFQPSSGRIFVDDAPLDDARLAQLRSEIAWIDPQVHLFRSTLYENLRYGNGSHAAARFGATLEAADLGCILERAPEGLQTAIGEGGTLVSGGEGQRIRIGRALGRSGVRLAILDEPARGLGREERRRMLTSLRAHFSGATLLCVTHDVSDTLNFDRVLVIEQGRILEQGTPRALHARPGSRYRAMCDEEGAARREMLADAAWRRLRLRDGKIREDVREDAVAPRAEGVATP